MTYFPHVVNALSAIRTISTPLVDAIEQASAAHTAFLTNGSGSRLQLESTKRNLGRIIEWAKRAETQTDEALAECPPMVKGHLTALEGGKPTPIVRRPSDDQPPPMRA